MEFPSTWSVNASTIVTTKYFRGAVDTDAREWSLKQLIDRVVSTYVKAGRDYGYFTTPGDADGLRARADLAAGQPVLLLQLPGLVQRRHPVAPAGLGLLHPLGRRLDGLDPQLVQGGGLHLQGRLRAPASTSPASAPPRSCCPPAARRAARSPSCAAPTRRPAPSSRAAPPAVRPRWSCSTSTTPTSSSSSRPRRARRTRSARCATPASTWTSAATTSPRCNTRTPTTPSASATSSCVRSRRAPTFGLRSPQDRRGHRDRRRPRAVPQDQQGRVGVRRPGTPVRRHDQRLAHQPRDRPHHRVQPVLRIHVARQLLVQPRLAQPAEVPQGRQHLRRRAVRQGRRGDHHRDGHLHLLRRLPDRGDRRRPPATTASSASATPTSARC